jgi:hypothetical protein
MTTQPHCIVIRVTRGSFRQYNRRTLLHCGVTNSQGVVYNFDKRGHHQDSLWEESICIKLSAIDGVSGGGKSTGSTTSPPLNDDRWDDHLGKCEEIHKVSMIIMIMYT